MARLVPVREELLRGDLRSLYIGWLAAVAGEMVGDEEMEPLSVSGLGSLISAQQALNEFLEVDQDLLAGAGMNKQAASKADISEQAMDHWLDALPRDEVNTVMKHLLEGRVQQAERSLGNRFASWCRELQTGDSNTSLRTVGALRQDAEKVRHIRVQKEKCDRVQWEARRQKERAAYLKNLVGDFPGAWDAVQKVVECGSARGYDEACRALVDLSAAYDLFAIRKQFQQDLKKFMAGHTRRKALIQRLEKADIWRGQY